MAISQLRPKLRPLDIRHHIQQGQPYFLLRDPQKITVQTLLVPQAFGPLLALCDGTHDLDQMALLFRHKVGVPVDSSLVAELLTVLDDALLLENERFHTAYQAVVEAFRTAPHRPPSLAGLSYPREPQLLWRHLQDYLEAVADVDPVTVDWTHPLGMLSPHIDYERGGDVYAQIWKRAAQVAREAELVVILGTDHYGSDPFTLTRQNYATPYGTLPTAQPIVDALATVIGEEAAFAGELRHRGEHSLELVAVWLHHMRAGVACPLVPILCGGFHRFFYNGEHPKSDPLTQQVIATLRAAIGNQRTLVIASGDLAHVGPAFGGNPLTTNSRTQLRQADEELLSHMCAGDAEAFFSAIRRVKDGNNVCGVAPIYLTMQSVGAARGEQFGYATCPADDTNTSAVTVGGVLFHGQP
ncbi:MAG: AmmeMemoRadiSam system protein B [Caldilineaceae bacterium]|nr:AmmeMemoRadiSam system protein B [Caldilineaceae bacterium]